MTITDVERLTDQRWLNLFSVTYEHHGKPSKWLMASRRASPVGLAVDAVVVVAVDRTDPAEPRLLLIREQRVPAGGPVLGLPAGLLEEGESVEEAVRRELLEETGFLLATVRRVTPPLFSSCGLTDEATALVFCDVVAPPGGAVQALDGNEDIEPVLMTRAELAAYRDAPTLATDNKAWWAVFHYAEAGFGG